MAYIHKIKVIPFEAEIKNNSMNYKEGESLEFVCEYTNMSQIQIQKISWFHNEKDITKNNQFGIKIQNNNLTLIIQNLDHLLHDGIYYCQIDVVLNTVYSIRSSSYMLNIECKRF